MEIKQYLSLLDSKRFGFNVAKVEDFDSSPEEVLHFLKKNNVKLVISKVSVDNLDLINHLGKLGFQIKDIQVTYRFDLANLRENKINKNENLLIRNAEPKDIPELQKIATESFHNYGHYAADNKLDSKKVNQIYCDWITRSCKNDKVADKVLVAEYNGKTVGFLSFKIYVKNNLRYAAGGIGAVSKTFRNINIFRTITYEGLLWGKKVGLDWEEHNVLINNYPVNRSFIKSGFYTYKSFATLHHWINE